MSLLQEGKRGTGDIHLMTIAILEFEEMIEKMGENWAIPDNYSIRYTNGQWQRLARNMAQGWVDFCDKAERGVEVMNKLKNEGVLTADLEGMRNYNIFNKVPHQIDVSTADFILSTKRAFQALLNPQTKQEVQEHDIPNAKHLVKAISEMAWTQPWPDLSDEED
jgi:hypothetical protein